MSKAQNPCEIQEFLGHYEVAEIEVTYHPKYIVKERPQTGNSREAYHIFKEVWQKDIQLRERFNVAYLNCQNNVLGIWEAFSGGIGSVSVDKRLVFATALKLNATGIMIAHNHPSGALHPSQADKRLTDSLLKAGGLFEIKLLDHLIITAENYFSFADEGLL